MSTRNSDMIPQASADEDTLRILLATDIHLGYAEKHPVKADDSFNTFDEILAIAKEQARLGDFFSSCLWSANFVIIFRHL